MDRPLRRPRRRIRRVRNPLVRGPRQSVLEGLLGRNSVRGRPHSVPPDCHGGDPGIRLRREVARRRAARRSMDDTTLADRLEREAGELFTRFNSDFWSDERGGYYLSRRGQTGHRLPHIESGPPTVVGDRARGARAHHCKPPPLRRSVQRLGCAHALAPGSRLQPDRLPHRDDLAARQRDRRPRAGALWVPREANRIALAQIEAATHSSLRLPEAFAGSTG